ncbi:MAG: DUF99 family protein [Candidatus Methanoglobus sp.]
MKSWRVVGIDDSFSGDFCCMVGCVMCGRNVEGFMYEEITVDGLDSTEKIIRMLKRSKFYGQLKCVFLNGITFGGFNLADISEIYAKTDIPVIVVMGREPDMEEFCNALKNLDNFEDRIAIVRRSGNIHRVKGLYLQVSGIGFKEAGKLVEENVFRGKIPEALRIAHLIASAIVHGESKNR